MPKRIAMGRTFMQGVRIGKTLQHFAIQLNHLLTKSGLTAEEAADKTEMERIRFFKLLCADYYTFITLTLKDLAKLGNTFDVAISVKIVSRGELSIPVVAVKTFEEEKDEVIFKA